MQPPHNQANKRAHSSIVASNVQQVYLTPFLECNTPGARNVMPRDLPSSGMIAPAKLPQLYGDHDDLAALYAPPAQPPHTGWEAHDVVELATLGGELLGDRGAWCNAVLPMVTHMERHMRGMKLPASDLDKVRQSAKYVAALRRDVREIVGNDGGSDEELIELCISLLQKVDYPPTCGVQMPLASS